jgi:nucleotide-binding universal stress UspA family protein
MNCDLIVMSVKHSLFSAPLFGSTIERVFATSPCPVLILPADFKKVKDKLNVPVKAQKILLNYDFNPAIEPGIEYSLSLVRKLNSELHLLYVLPRPENTGTELSQIPAGMKLTEKLIYEKLN